MTDSDAKPTARLGWKAVLMLVILIFLGLMASIGMTNVASIINALEAIAHGREGSASLIRTGILAICKAAHWP